MPLGSCQCRNQLYCWLRAYTTVPFGGRPGNIDNAPLDTRYLQSAEKYREYGVDYDGKTYDYTKWVIWTYPRWTGGLPTLQQIQRNLAGSGRYWHPVHNNRWTGPDNPAFPIVDATLTSNTVATVTHDYTEGTYEYHLRATRTFDTPVQWSEVYAKCRAIHLLHSPADFATDGDIVIAGRSLRQHRLMIQYPDATGSGQIVIGPTYEHDFWHQVYEPQRNMSGWILYAASAVANAIGGGLGDQWTSPESALYRASIDPLEELSGLQVSVNFEPDFMSTLGVSEGNAVVAYPAALIYWTVWPDTALSETCAISPAYQGDYIDHFTNATPFRRQTVPRDWTTGADGTETCAPETVTDTRWLIWDPAPPSSPPANSTWEYAMSGSCP